MGGGGGCGKVRQCQCVPPEELPTSHPDVTEDWIQIKKKKISMFHQIQNIYPMFPPGLEPWTFRVLGERDNHYTTETEDSRRYALVRLVLLLLTFRALYLFRHFFYGEGKYNTCTNQDATTEATEIQKLHYTTLTKSSWKTTATGNRWKKKGGGVTKVINEVVPFSQARWCEGRQQLQAELMHPASSRGFHAGRRLRIEEAQKILCSATIRRLDCRACPCGPRSLTPTSWWSAFLKGQRVPCRWTLGESMYRAQLAEPSLRTQAFSVVRGWRTFGRQIDVGKTAQVGWKPEHRRSRLRVWKPRSHSPWCQVEHHHWQRLRLLGKLPRSAAVALALCKRSC